MLITLRNVTYTYPGMPAPALAKATLEVAEGEMLLLVGESGAGKSTLLRLLNGLVPHFYGGTISGEIRVAGHNPIVEGTAALSAVVGMVFQDPEAQTVADTVEDELAFAMENAGLAPALMRKRIEEVLHSLSIAHLRGRRTSTLSGGERQRVAIGAVLTLQPRVLVLDEPTSQLDPQGAEEVLDTLVKLNQDLGLTILLSEHRLERVVQHVDRVAYLENPGPDGQTTILTGPPAEILCKTRVAPPLAEVARLLGWERMPLNIKEARRMLAADSHFPPLATPPTNSPAVASAQDPILQAMGVWFRYGTRDAIQNLSVSAYPGEVLALMGRNGAGKTTLLKLLVGLLKPTHGHIRLAGSDTGAQTLENTVRRVGFVPQRPDILLFCDSGWEELAFTRRNHGLPTTSPTLTALVEQLGLGPLLDRDPKDLSVGQRQRLALGAVLSAEPDVLLLDEPTRGMDYRQKAALGHLLRELAAAGRAVLLATHDVELAAKVADRVVLLSEGQVVVEGPAREVMSGSLVFSSQVNKLFQDPRLVTPADVAHYLALRSA